jgi:MscS family membrane protein
MDRATFAGMGDWLTSMEWEIEVFIIVLGTGVVHLAARLVVARLLGRLRRTRSVYDDALIESVGPPLAFAIWVIGIGWAADVIAGVSDPAEVFRYVSQIRDAAVLWAFVWFALRFIRSVENHLIEDGYRGQSVDRTTVVAVGRLLRASIIITGVLLMLQSLGFSVTGLLAFGGIGGAAVGFAAKDLLANFFGALVIFLDRPFSVGDWIRSPDREIEGTVEAIGWRVTRIRTFDQRPLYVPNSAFTTLAVENPSRMLNRRIYETIGVRYTDVAVVAAIVGDVEAMLRGHPAIDQKRTLMVNFNRFGASSLDFFIYTFTRTTVWTEFHAIKQDVLLEVAAIIASHGAEIAFPTRTVEFAGPMPEPAAVGRSAESADAEGSSKPSRSASGKA